MRQNFLGNCAILPTTQTLLRITSALDMRINFELLAKPTRKGNGGP